MRYPGGKGKCYQRIINLMPQHNTYIETHLGGGAIMRNKAPAQKNIGIDLNSQVINRWRADYNSVCNLVNDDALHYLINYEFSGDELVYVDPPYLASTRRQTKIYRHEYSDEDHICLLRVLAGLPCYVMISGYENPMYDNFLRGWRKEKFNAKTQVDVREECVWMNFPPPEKLHDARYLGKNFRERQTIARRQMRLYDRIEKMDMQERNELIQWVNSKYASELI